MITDSVKHELHKIWDNYAKNKTVLDTNGRVISEIDERRVIVSEYILKLIAEFLSGNMQIGEFKSALDSYNKKNNLWGFTATKGQMFFNLLTRSSESTIEHFSSLLKNCIKKPHTIADALHKIEQLEAYVQQLFKNAPDKRKAPNPSSCGYFLSYFWQIQDPLEWPIMYTSILKSFTDLKIWQEQPSQKESYRHFYDLNEQIKDVLSHHAKQQVSNWDAEHAFWNVDNPHTAAVEIIAKKVPEISSAPKEQEKTIVKASFDKNDFLIPKVSRLTLLGSETESSSGAKGSEYEKMVVEIFRQLDFEVTPLGQGKGRNPDAIVKYREDHTAFIVDAKAYASGYSLGLDDRAIREYISHHCPILKKEGFTKLGFIIVSNSFKTSFDQFINEITWNTDIKRFLLITSEALLYLLAYKTKDKLTVPAVIETLVTANKIIDVEEIISEFDDV